MANMPNKMKIGFGLGLFGGIVALVAMAMAWENDIASMYPVGLNMLCAVMFFAAGGALSKEAPVSGNTALVLAVIALAAVIVGYLYAATFVWLTFLMAIIAVACILVAACPNTSKFLDDSRLA